MDAHLSSLPNILYTSPEHVQNIVESEQVARDREE